MPCYDPGWPDDHPNSDISQRKKLEAMLCGVMSVLEEYGSTSVVFERFNEREAGVSMKELSDWWNAHKEEDRQRREREDTAREVERKKAAALAKLSPAERRILGLDK